MSAAEAASEIDEAGLGRLFLSLTDAALRTDEVGPTADEALAQRGILALGAFLEENRELVGEEWMEYWEDVMFEAEMGKEPCVVAESENVADGSDVRAGGIMSFMGVSAELDGLEVPELANAGNSCALWPFLSELSSLGSEKRVLGGSEGPRASASVVGDRRGDSAEALVRDVGASLWGGRMGAGRRSNSQNASNRREHVTGRRSTVSEGDGEEEEEEEEEEDGKFGPFVSARMQLSKEEKKDAKKKKSLGGKRKFRPPARVDENGNPVNAQGGGGGGGGVKRRMKDDGERGGDEDEDLPEELRNLEPRMIEMIENEIRFSGDPTTFDDIAGLAHAKRAMLELVVWPMQRPDLFTGLRSLPKGVLLFGPPGTGKTLIGKAIAHSCGATFFSISSSSLTSKWIGEGEKMVRTLFAVAAVRQPSVIFIDEIDSLLTARTDTDNEASRRIKTEFLVQLDGATTREADRILVLGATNRPSELDEAARRRFVKRLYIPLPDPDARRALIRHLLNKNKNILTDDDVESITTQTHGYSGADVTELCRAAAMGPLRKGLAGIAHDDIANITEDSMPPITPSDFADAIRQVRSSVARKELASYEAWNKTFGSFPLEDVLTDGAPKSTDPPDA